MKNFKTFLLLILLGFCSCQFFGNSKGKKYDFNSVQNIYYKGEGTNEADAKKLAEYLYKIGYFIEGKALSVQITKEKATKDTLNINFVVDESKLNNKLEKVFLQIGSDISLNVYNSNPVNINLVDAHLKLIKKLGYASSVNTNGKRYDLNSKQNIFYKGEGLSEEDAKKIAGYLYDEIGYFGGDNPITVQITKETETKDTLNINFVVNKSRVTSKIEKNYLQMGGNISKDVYNNNPVNVNLIDNEFKLVKNLGYTPPLAKNAADKDDD